MRPGLVHGARCGTTRPGSGSSRRDVLEQVPVAVVLVDDQPGRDVRASVALLLVHHVHDVAVGRGLVDEPLAGAVDQDAAGQGPLGQAEVRLARAAGSPAPTRRRPSGRARRRPARRPRCRRRCSPWRRRSSSTPIGCRWYSLAHRARCARSRPSRRSTPRGALTSGRRPFRDTSTPVTRPALERAGPRSGVFSHTGTSAAEQPGAQPAGQRLAHGERLLARATRPAVAAATTSAATASALRR